MSLIVHPAARSDARDNLNRTVIEGVPLTDALIEILGEDAPYVMPGVHDGRIRLYGTNRGDADRKRPLISRIAPGDSVAYNAANAFRVTGRVVHVLENRALADAMAWGTHRVRSGEEQPFELIYTLADVRRLDPPVTYDEVRHALAAEGLPYFDNQAMTIVADERTSVMERVLGITHLTFAPRAPSPVMAPTAVADDDVETDVERFTKARREQAEIRRLVVIGAETQCALCLRTFPSRFVWAAHIKKRSECSPQERRMLTEVAMAACTFGCDQLYEEGLLGVDDTGAVVVSPHAPATGAVADYLVQFRASPRRSAAWRTDSPQRTAFFAWHHNKVFKT